MIIPQDLLKAQLCSECQQYLSVPPVKVYPNRHVKCGRCARDDDNGVISHSYEMVVKDFEFPCVNHLEGCSKVLKYHEVEDHEKNCIVYKYDCPFCNNFEGTTYYLKLHLEKFHSSDALRCSEILVQLDVGNIQKVGWYCNESTLLIVMCYYDPAEQKLWFNVNVMGYRLRNCLMQKFTLLNVENQVKHKSKTTICSMWNSSLWQDAFLCKINAVEYPNYMAVCQFAVTGIAIDMPKVTPSHINAGVNCNILDQNNLPCIVDPMATSVQVNATFKNISKLEVGPSRLYFEIPFYVNNLKWKVYVGRRDSKFLKLFLMSLDLDKSTTPGLRFKFTLISANERKNKCWASIFSKNIIWHQDQGIAVCLVSWTELMDKSNGYVDQNDSIRVEVFVEFKGKVQLSCSSCRICKNCIVCEKCTTKLSKE